MEMEIVERNVIGTDIKDELERKLLETLDTNKAVKVTLDLKANFTNWQSTLRNRMRKHNLRVRVQYNKGTRTATCWVESLGD